MDGSTYRTRYIMSATTGHESRTIVLYQGLGFAKPIEVALEAIVSIEPNFDFEGFVIKVELCTGRILKLEHNSNADFKSVATNLAERWRKVMNS